MCDDDEPDRGLAGLSPEFQAMVGGLAGHTASFAKMLERRSAKQSQAEGKRKDDDVYLESYADLAIHEDMLKDLPRVEAYRKGIEAYGANWKERGNVTVVDVGSGTGLLAVFASRAGAKRVVVVEASRLAHFLPEIAAANAPAGAIEVKACRAEDLELDGLAPTADVVVSEWMGYFMLFENMLPSVLAVRDRHLRPGGQMLPSRCRLQLAPMEDSAWRSAHLDFWRSVHGVDMSALQGLAKATCCEKACHRLINASSLLGPATEVLCLDLHTAKEADFARFEAPLCIVVPAGRRLDGFASWFDCEFGIAGWLLSTSPESPPTHWRQTTFQLRQPIEGGGGITVSGTVVVERHEDYSRGYRVSFELCSAGRQRRTESFELR